ncbi:hypothetical protein L1N85_18190 [Paenibacillus alkaliterrae]|uniref:hypothetical protein n=1 Tax=Paenibacillus alkaliterrae TaxID=320909 RepID=UPI001F3B2F20|nr:hypothetical protein [Paenibacillus alkaliterrae]MCF2940336.1 hypothetical protein [Paenibacillus alkaliterrae]
MTNQVMAEKQYGLAVRFMKENARAIERALYEFEYEAGSSDEVLRQLAAYQNADGGFGHGLEPDIRLAASSVLATTVALHHLIGVKAARQSPIVQGAIRYLIENYNTTQNTGWDIVPPDVETAPRAPWWNYNASHDGWGNPAIEIVGFFYAYSELVPAALLDELTQHAITHINKKSTRKDFHELLCCLRFAELVPNSVLHAVKEALDEMVNNCVSTDPSQWEGYCLTPVQVAESPESLYYNQLKESGEQYMGHLLTKQQEDGSWSPPWNWGQFEEVWPQAEQEWKGVLTLEALRRLKAYGIVSS